MSWRPWLTGVLLIGCGEVEAPGYTPSTGVAAGSTTADASSTDASSGGLDDTSSTGDAQDTPDGSTGTSSAEAEGSTAASTGESTGICGDGHLDPGEECDNGFAANSLDAYCLMNCVVATCGDGYVRTGVEECDDANDDVTDGCDLNCGRTRKVFVTSATYQGHQFMGLWGADQRCGSLAAQAGLPNFLGYKAWLSDSTTSPVERMYHGKGRYELVNGLLVAENWDALVAGELVNPISVTEKSETHDIGVWTGTNPDGTAAEGANHCLDWTSNDNAATEFYGISTEITADWTLLDVDFNPTTCSEQAALYCFEQE